MPPRWRLVRGLVEGAALAGVLWLGWALFAEAETLPPRGTLMLGTALGAVLAGLSRLVAGGIIWATVGAAVGGLIGLGAAGKPPPPYYAGGGTFVGKPAKIDGPTLDGDSYDITQYRGKVVVVDFWATWCRPCVAEMPELIRLYRRHHDEGLEIVGISHDGSEAALRKFVTTHEVPWPQVLFPADPRTGERANPNARAYQVDRIPHALVVGRDGTILAEGVRGESLLKVVEQALREGQAERSRLLTLLLLLTLGSLAGMALEWSMRNAHRASERTDEPRPTSS